MAAAREMNYALIFRADVSALKPAANDVRDHLAAVGAAARQASGALDGQARAVSRVATAARALSESPSTGRDRAADIAAYGKALDDTRAKIDPLFAVTRKYQGALAEIRQAVKVGAIEQRDAEVAITRTTAAYDAQTAAIRRADSALETQARNRKRAAEAIVAGQTITPDRAGDIAAYGKALDDGRARWDPLYAAVRKYRDAVKEIRELEKAGAFGVGADAARRATDAIRREREQLRGVVAQERSRRGGGATGGQLEPWQRQNLTYQIYDIGTSLASGMPLPMVAAQQGPQIAQIYGGVTPALKAIGQALTPVRLGVGAVTTALVVGATAWDGYLSSTKAVETVNAGLGRRLGATAMELEAQARAGAAAGGVSVKSAREMEIAFLRTGKVGVRHYADLIGMARDFGATLGTDAAGGAAKLADILADPARGAQVLSRELGLLDGVTARYAQRLAATGRTEEARAVLIDALPDRLASAADATTAFGRAWDVVARNASDAMDAIGAAIDRAVNGGDQAAAAQIKALEQQRQELLLEQRNEGVRNQPNTVMRRRADADAIEAEAATLTSDDLRDDGPRERTGGRRRPSAAAIAVRRIDDKLAALRPRAAAEAAATEEARRKAEADAAITRGYDVASGSAGPERARRMRGLRDDIGALQGALDAGATGSERDDITSAIEAKRRALAALEQQQARNTELDRLDVAIQAERVPAIRAELIARRDALRIDDEEIDNPTAAERKDAARTKAYADASAQIATITRDRREASADQVAALEAEIATLGRSAGAVAELEAVTRALAQARREAKGGIVDPEEEARIRADAAAIGQATDRAAAARLIDDIRFERAQLNRPAGEQDIAARLRSARIDPSSVEGQQAAAELRALDALKKQRAALEGIKDEAKDYLGIIRESTGAWDAGEKILDRFLEKLSGRVEDYLLNAALGVPQPGLTLGALAGFGAAANHNGRGAGLPLTLGPSPASAVLAPPPAGAGISASALRWAPQVTAEATRAGIDPSLALAVLDAESRGRPDARSPAGAIGLMQLMPGTAADLGVNPADPAENVRGGVDYLAMLNRRYGGDRRRMLAAYNWGMGNVDGWNGDMGTLPRETRSYIGRVEGALGSDATRAAGAIDQLATSTGTAATSADALGTGFDGLGQATSGLFAQLGSGLDRLLSGLGGGASGLGSWFASLFGSGSAAAQTGIPTIGSLYDRGGYTGPGGVHEPRGIVHAGEIVWSQADIRRVGGVAVAEAVRTGARGYASGGVVGVTRAAGPARVSVSADRVPAPGETTAAPGAWQGTPAPSVTVQVNNYGSEPVDQEETVDAAGNRTVLMTIGDRGGAAMRQRGNPLRRATMSEFGLRPRGIPR